MNQSESIKLASIASKCMYGVGCSRGSFIIGKKILQTFPDIEEFFDDFNNIDAADQIAFNLIVSLATHKKYKQSMNNLERPLSNVILDWCIDTKQSPVDYIDTETSNTLLTDKQFKGFLLGKSEYNEELRELVELL